MSHAQYISCNGKIGRISYDLMLTVKAKGHLADVVCFYWGHVVCSGSVESVCCADQRLYIAQDQGTVRGYMVILLLVFDIQSKYKLK